MTRNEMKKVLVIQKCIDQVITISEAAEALGISQRQVIRLKIRLKEKGAEGIIHKNRGKKPGHAFSKTIQEQIVTLYQSDKYVGSNDCHFSELLTEHEKITASPSTVRRLLLGAGIKRAKQRRRPKSHRPRERKAQEGMLWQTDATPYDWLEGRGSNMALVAAIDDATGIVIGAIFQPNEDMASYFEVMRQGIQQYGLPLALYSDRHTIFRSPNETLTLEQELAGEAPALTNFGKAMKDLSITHIKARTPQAKGRIERLWLTFQDRLVIELRIENVSNIEEANAILPKLIAKHNKRFAVKAVNTESAYRVLQKDLKLEYIFCVREKRIVNSGETISYNGKVYTIKGSNKRELIPVKTKVEIRVTMKKEVLVIYKGLALHLKEVIKSEQVNPVVKQKTAIQPRKPAADHPWKTGSPRKIVLKAN